MLSGPENKMPRGGGLLREEGGGHSPTFFLRVLRKNFNEDF